jgi:hypothetical protein
MKTLVQKITFVIALIVSLSANAAAPLAPANLQQAWLVTESLLLWDEVPEATGYNVYRADDTNTAWALVASNLAEPRWRDEAWQFLPSYYVVTAVNAEGESPASDIATVNEAWGFTISIGDINIWNNTLTSSNALVNWVTSNPDGDQGIVEWGTAETNATNFTFFLLNTNYLPWHNFNLTNLAPLTAYNLRITSISSNRGGVSVLRSFTTPDTNHPPVAEAFTWPWPIPTNGMWVTLRGYDSNQPPAELAFRIVSQPTNGTLSAIQTWWQWNEAIVFYTPAPGARGYDHFQYVVNNGTWDSAPALVTLTNWVNSLPAVTNGFLTTAEDTPMAFTLPVFDAEGDPVTFEINPWSVGNGTVSGTPPNLIFTPSTNFNGFAWFWYQVSDGYEQTFGNISIEVTPVNDPPVIMTDFIGTITTWEDQPNFFYVPLLDVDGLSSYEIIQVTAPAHGTIGIEENQVVYRGETNYFGSDSFVLKVREADGTTSEPATIPVEVMPVNDMPVALDQNVTTLEDTAIVITPTATDIDSPAVFTFHVSSQGGPAHGWVEETGTNFIYHPAPDFNGTDEFTFEAVDDHGWYSWDHPGTIRIQVTPVIDLVPVEDLRRRIYEDRVVRLWWNAAPEAESYNIYRADETNGPFTLLVSGITETNFSDATAEFQHAYWYQIRAAAGAEEGPASGTVFAYPNDTGMLTLDQHMWPIHATTGSVQFISSIITGIEGVFEYGTNREYGVFLENTNLLPGQRFSLSNLTPATVYYFRIIATDINGNAIVVSTNYYQDWFATETAPLATAQSVYVSEDLAQNITLAGFDPNYSFHPLTYAVVTGPAHGSLTGSGANLVYTPVANYSGPDSFTFKVNNGELDSAPATVTIDVMPMNDLPVVADLSITNAEDNSITIAPQFSDLDGGFFVYVEIVMPPAHGVAEVSGTDLLYTPGTNYFGPDSFTYRISDGYGFGNTASISLNITNVNDEPVVTNLSFTTAEDTALLLRSTMVAFDTDGHALTLLTGTGAAHGTVIQSGTNLLYTPFPNYFGADSFTLRVSDGNVTSENLTVAITVSPVNDQPIASGLSGGVFEDMPNPINFVSYDPDGGTPVYTVLTLPAHGTLSGAGASRIYTPATNYSGPDSFTYKVNDGFTDSAPATVSLTIVALNDAPIANPLSLNVDEDSSANFTLTAIDVDSGALTFNVVAGSTNGTLTGTVPNLTYTPNANFHGADSIQFSVSDGSLSSTALVSFTVLPLNDGPVANSQSASTSEDTAVVINLTGSDLDGDGLAFTVVTTPMHGTLSGTGASLTYTPAANYSGPDSFTFKANDGSVDSASATVSLVITPVNDEPVADAQAVGMAEDSAGAITLTATDIDGDALTYAILAGPAHGTLSGTAPNLIYTPEENYFGADSFTFKVNDGNLDSAQASININVASVNDAPVANAQSVSVIYNTAKSITLTGSDLEGSTLTYTVVNGPTNGILDGVAPNLTYTPNIGSAGADSFTFHVDDGVSNSAPATVSVTTLNPVGISPAPTSLTITVPTATKTLILNWSCTATNEDGFKIERSLSSGSGWSQIATVGINAHTFTNTGLTSNTRYYYRVRSYNRIGNSAYSNIVNAKAR